MIKFRGRCDPYIHMDEAAALFNRSVGPGSEVWDAAKIRRFLRRNGAAFKMGGRYVTTIRALQEAFPAVWHNLLMALADSEDEDESNEEGEEKKRSGTVVNGGRM